MSDGVECYPYALFPPDGQTRGNQGMCLGGTLFPTAFLTGAVLVAITFPIGCLLRQVWRPTLSAEAAKMLRRKNEARGARSPPLPAVAEAEVQREVAQFAALAAVSIPLWTAVGLRALYLSATYCAWYSSADPLNFQNDPAIMSSADLGLHNSMVFVGELFMGYLLFMTVMWCVGWDDGWDTIMHHIAFLIITFLQGQYGALTKLGGWAVVMELSTPPLFGMLVFRQVAGTRADGKADPEVPHRVNDLCGPAFAVLFFACRIFCFGWQLWEAVVVVALHWGAVFPAKPNALPAWQGVTIISIYTLGWAMQLYWGRALAAKVMRKLRGAPPPRPAAGARFRPAAQDGYGGVDGGEGTPRGSVDESKATRTVSGLSSSPGQD